MKRDNRTFAVLAAGAVAFLALSACTSGGNTTGGGNNTGGGNTTGGGHGTGSGNGASGGNSAASGHGAGGGPSSSSAPGAVGTPPPTTGAGTVTLRLTSGELSAGGTVDQPVKISYTLAGSGAAGLGIRPSAGYKLRFAEGDNPAKSEVKRDIPVSAASGAVTLPENPMYSGTGDVTFALLSPRGAVLTSVTVRRLTIIGPR